MEQGSLVLGSAPPGSLAALDGRPLRVTGDGRFAFGFAPDQVTASLVTVRYPDGGGDSRSYTPKARQYEIQRINGLPQNTVTPPPEVKERIAREAEAIFLARLDDTPGRDILSGFDWPAPGVESGVFGSQRIDNGVPMSPHYGVDMAAPTERSRRGRLPAEARIAGAISRGRCAAMTSLGSMAITWRSEGSYEPVPAPTLTMVRASARAA